MYRIGRPLMPPLSFTQSKYALAVLPMVVKSTPGISMSIPPSLIGAPVAFFPLPRPQTPAARALPWPTRTSAELEAPVAQVVIARPARTIAVAATPNLNRFALNAPSSFRPERPLAGDRRFSARTESIGSGFVRRLVQAVCSSSAGPQREERTRF